MSVKTYTLAAVKIETASAQTLAVSLPPVASSKSFSFPAADGLAWRPRLGSCPSVRTSGPHPKCLQRDCPQSRQHINTRLGFKSLVFVCPEVPKPSWFFVRGNGPLAHGTGRGPLACEGKGHRPFCTFSRNENISPTQAAHCGWAWRGVGRSPELYPWL